MTEVKTETTEKKTRKATGPRKKAPQFLMLKVNATDSAGNKIVVPPDAVELIGITTNAADVLVQTQADRDVIYKVIASSK